MSSGYIYNICVFKNHLIMYKFNYFGYYCIYWQGQVCAALTMLRNKRIQESHPANILANLKVMFFFWYSVSVSGLVRGDIRVSHHKHKEVAKIDVLLRYLSNLNTCISNC